MKLYPPGQITPYGAALLLEGVEPLIIYTTPGDPDTAIQWCINGGLAPWPGVQEGAYLTDGIKGQHPSFKFVESKGARQPGVTVQRTVYDPAEYELAMEFGVPSNPSDPQAAAAAIRRVIRDWFASWDPENPGTFAWITPEMGRWWCTPRLFRTPPDSQFREQARRLRQRYQWTIRNDDAFWRGVDSVSDFEFLYVLARDTFNRDDVGTLGPQWQQTYTGAGAGTCETDGGRARWIPSGTTARTVVNRLLGINEVQTVSIVGTFSGGTWTYSVNGQTTTGIAFNASATTFQTAIEALSNVAPGDVTVTGNNGGPYTVAYKGALAFTNITSLTSGAALTPGGTATAVRVATALNGCGPNTATDNQVIAVDIGDVHQWPFPTNGYLDIWGRMNNNDANPTGVRARIGGGQVVLSRFNAGVETVMSTVPLLISPAWWETWTLQCGTATTPRQFKLKRNKFKVLDFKETGTGSALGVSNRGSGWGMTAGAGSTQQVPPSLDEFRTGDNATVTQSGHLTLTNFGDQTAPPRYLVYGPGTFRIANGSNSDKMIEFGPLTDSQIALLTTNPRLRGVVDLSPDQPEQDLTAFQAFVETLLSLATNNNIPPLLEWFESLLGIRPPQGEMYSLLNGRFSNPVEKKPAGAPPATASIKVEIVNGNADSKVVAALTPMRRWPE